MTSVFPPGCQHNEALRCLEEICLLSAGVVEETLIFAGEEELPGPCLCRTMEEEELLFFLLAVWISESIRGRQEDVLLILSTSLPPFSRFHLSLQTD